MVIGPKSSGPPRTLVRTHRNGVTEKKAECTIVIQISDQSQAHSPRGENLVFTHKRSMIYSARYGKASSVNEFAQAERERSGVRNVHDSGIISKVRTRNGPVVSRTRLKNKECSKLLEPPIPSLNSTPARGPLKMSVCEILVPIVSA